MHVVNFQPSCWSLCVLKVSCLKCLILIFITIHVCLFPHRNDPDEFVSKVKEMNEKEEKAKERRKEELSKPADLSESRTGLGAWPPKVITSYTVCWTENTWFWVVKGHLACLAHLLAHSVIIISKILHWKQLMHGTYQPGSFSSNSMFNSTDHSPVNFLRNTSYE